MSTTGVDRQSEADQTAGEAELRRLLRLLRVVEGAWAFAVYEDGSVQRALIDRLRAALAPLPLVELSLVSVTPDPLALLGELPGGDPAPVVCFTNVGSAFDHGLAGYLELQRDTLARLPQRLVFWVTAYDLRIISRDAPNFVSRLNGVFHFPGARPAPAPATSETRPTPPMPEDSLLPERRRPRLLLRDERQRQRRIAQQRRRIHDLERMEQPDAAALGDSWYDLAGFYDYAPPYDHSEDSMTQSAEEHRHEAEALIAQGRAALLAGDQAAADRLLAAAVAIYEELGDSYSVAAQTGNYGWALRRAGRPDDARPYLLRAAELFAALGMDDFVERHRRAAADTEPSPLTADLLAGLPAAVRAALQRGDGAALQRALDALPLAEQQLVFNRLIEAGVISEAGGATAEEALRQFELLLLGIAAVARGESEEREEIEAALADLERKGWQIHAAAHAIWAGQRDAQALTRGLDEADARLVQRILELI